MGKAKSGNSNVLKVVSIVAAIVVAVGIIAVFVAPLCNQKLYADGNIAVPVVKIRFGYGIIAGYRADCIKHDRFSGIVSSD